MKNYLMSAAVGDIAGSAYEGRTHRTKDYAAVKLFSSRAKFTDDTVLTFACTEAFLDGKDMAWNLWKCTRGSKAPSQRPLLSPWAAMLTPLQQSPVRWPMPSIARCPTACSTLP